MFSCINHLKVNAANSGCVRQCYNHDLDKLHHGQHGDVKIARIVSLELLKEL